MDYKKGIFDLKGKIAIVTGGVGTLGCEYVRALSESDAKVSVFDTRDENENPEFLKLKEEYSVDFYRVDITNRNEIEKALIKIKGRQGIPSILINNAAIDFPPTKVKELFEDYPIDKWEKTMDVNVTGILLCCQVIGGEMAKNKDGSIINISSTYGIVSPDQRIYKDFIKPVSYSVSKGAVPALSRYLATYWGNKNVRVNTLTLGGVFNNQDKDFVEKYSERTPLGRMAKKDEYNGAILFLSSDASSYMTGANLIIDGGWTAW